MANISTTKEKRDFLATEIRRRIIGPGFAHEAYACKPDCSDEVLCERPNRVYVAGFLSPQTDSDEFAQTNTLGTLDNSEQNYENIFSDDNLTPFPFDEAISLTTEDDTYSKHEDSADEQASRPDDEDTNSEDKESERPDFAPYYMGLITCISSDCDHVDIQATYGLYNQVLNVESDVIVPWGRCTKEQIEIAFEEYNRYLKPLLFCMGKESMADLFSIDYKNKTISPKGIFSFHDENGKRNYLRANLFPDLLHNRVARVVCQLLSRPTKEYEVKPLIKSEDFFTAVSRLESSSPLRDFISENALDNISSHITYDEETCRAKIELTNTFDPTVLSNGDDLLSKLLIDNPVREYLLPRLLKTHFFKRSTLCDTGTIDLTQGSRGCIDDFSDNLQIQWKTFSSLKSPDKKYLRVLAKNKNIQGSRFETEDDSDSSRRKVTPPYKWLYQFQLRVSSPCFVSYTEPHVSTIDEEFQLNEKLYSKEKMYGKGVNCALTWEHADDEEENTSIPKWVETTCSPKQKVRSFSTQIKTEELSIDQVLDVYGLSYFSDKSNETIIAELHALSDAYNDWHRNQKNNANQDSVLQKVIQEQSDFLTRFNENIDYLAKQPRAMRCFRIANAAMYIQMLLTKDEHFRGKNRNYSDYSENFNYGNNKYQLLNFFRNSLSNFMPKYRPFQLAFLVMNVKSTFENSDPYRNDSVDLIWFPTGGGKTEAYLALTALTIAERRTSNEQEDVGGISVIMRYTLRMLTAQQFQRASYLITALEFLREADSATGLGEIPITIGMWIGGGVSPNRIDDLKKSPYKEYFDDVNGHHMPERNPFPISSCPWCGCKLTHFNPINNRVISGYGTTTGGPGSVGCINESCAFFDDLPIDYIDEKLYNNPPTLLFATVDKFAQITKPGAEKLFGIGTTSRRKPDLIIQDELHLISGPLGSMVGMFESIIEELCSQKNGNQYQRRPKIVASTATTRNTAHLVRELYNRTVRTFPVTGVSYEDNFFSYAQPLKDSKRLYMGLAPTAHTAAELEIRTIAAELIAKEIMAREILRLQNVDLLNINDVIHALGSLPTNKEDDIDNYWTIVSYYINKQSLGKTCSRVGQEIRENVNNMRDFIETYPSLDPILDNFENRTTELTARQDNDKIRQLLDEAEKKRTTFISQVSKYTVAGMDIVLATNMISVGIDIARWNLINMIGQPLTTAEYIQSSSRVGRTYDGLVVSLYNPLRTRELSYYENYIAYHQVFYKYVEPLSVTSFTEMTLKKLLCNIFAAYMLLIKGRTKIGEIQCQDVQDLKDFINERSFSINSMSNAAFKPNMINLIDHIFSNYFDASVNTLLRNVYIRSYLDSDKGITYPKNAAYPKMGSLRDVESNTHILYEKINNNTTK